MSHRASVVNSAAALGGLSAPRVLRSEIAPAGLCAIRNDVRACGNGPTAPPRFDAAQIGGKLAQTLIYCAHLLFYAVCDGCTFE